MDDALKKDVQEWLSYYEKNKYGEYLDDNGYPTETALNLIRKWHWLDIKGCFEFIKNIWTYKNYWREDISGEKNGEPAVTYHVSTAGWSGNESLIEALMRNEMIWHLSWVQSKRGGHYIFEYIKIRK